MSNTDSTLFQYIQVCPKVPAAPPERVIRDLPNGHQHASKVFAFGADGWGAWEAALRLSQVDLNDGALSGGRQTDLTAALNWYINDDMQLRINYVAGRMKGREHRPAIDRGRVEILQARFGIEF